MLQVNVHLLFKPMFSFSLLLGDDDGCYCFNTKITISIIIMDMIIIFKDVDFSTLYIDFCVMYRDQRERSPDYQKLCAPTNHILWKWRSSANRCAMESLRPREPPSWSGHPWRQVSMVGPSWQVLTFPFGSKFLLVLKKFKHLYIPALSLSSRVGGNARFRRKSGLSACVK